MKVKVSFIADFGDGELGNNMKEIREAWKDILSNAVENDPITKLTRIKITKVKDE